MEQWKLYGHLEDDSIEFTTILQTSPSDKAETLIKVSLFSPKQKKGSNL